MTASSDGLLARGSRGIGTRWAALQARIPARVRGRLAAPIWRLPMYVPPPFGEPRIEVMHDLIESYPLGALVTAARAGLFATHLPFVLDRTAGAFRAPRGHIARANPHHPPGGAAPPGGGGLPGPPT